MIAPRSTIRRSLPARLRAGGAAIVLLAAGGMIVLFAACSTAPTQAPGTPEATAGPTQAPGTPEATAGPTQTPGTPEPTAESTPPATTDLKVYLLLGEKLVAVQRRVPQTSAVGRAALEALVVGPAAGESALGTTVPAGTLVLGLTIEAGLATVDLSREFESGGGSASMFGRLAQVVFTLTQFPTVDRVAFELDGEPATVFSGEGIILDQPSVRADFESFLPAIFVDRPAWGGTLPNPARVIGMANVFEASFLVEVRDAAGRALVNRPVMATCGTGCWGTFDVTIPYQIGSPQAGSLVVYNLSAKDGSVEDLISYPVTLTP